MSNACHTPQPLPCWLGLTDRWKACFSSDVLRLQQRQGNASWHVLDITLQLHRGWFWSRVTLTKRDQGLELHGLSHANAELLQAVLERQKKSALERIEADLQADHARLGPVWKDVKTRLNVQRYLSARDRDEIERIFRTNAEFIDAANARSRAPHAAGLAIAGEVSEIVKPLCQILLHCADFLTARNSRFVDQELQRWRGFFDHCEERPLTDEQARAAITFEENTLLVAAAGSGKTSTVVGKVAYALAKGIAKPEEILCLAFNGKAAKEIGARIETRLAAMTQPDCPIDSKIKAAFTAMLRSGIKIESRTFHSLGLKIVRDVEGSNTMVSQDAESKRRLQRAIERCKRDPRFLTNWLLLQTMARFARPVDSRFRSEAEYLEYLRGMWRQRKLRRKTGEEDGILSLGCTKLVKSFEEVAISNWLYLMGVEFEYEAPFDAGASLLCPGKSWTPDFTYRVQDAQGERVVVHEHFALDTKGQAPGFFTDPPRYAREAQAKNLVLQQLDPRHFSTTSAEYIEGTLFPKLEAKLRAAGVPIQPRDEAVVLQRLEKIGHLPDNQLIQTAVSQIRQNAWDRSTLESRLPREGETFRARLFLDVVWPVAEAVKELLVEDKRLDFDEMIRRALGYLRDQPGLLPYRLILADEFQDTAPGRGELARQMLHSRADSLFFAVGDDWQAINRFAGSDLQFFNRFGQTFNRRDGADKRCDLTHTFRSNQGIADVAKHFVLKNKTQLPKDVVAQDKTTEGVIDVCMYRDDGEVFERVEATLHRWVSQHIGGKPSVFLLGRYGNPRACGLGEHQMGQLCERWADRIELIKGDGDKPPTLYSTMHRSKGLQADYVLILGLFRAEHDWLCFPSEREDDPLLQLVLPPKEALADADERRLFYVALTRAKRQVVLFAHDRYPSPYALDLLRDHRDGRVLLNGAKTLPPMCPVCKTGLIFPRPIPKSGGTFYACSDRYGCGKTWQQWPPVPPTSMLRPKLAAIGRRALYGVGGRKTGTRSKNRTE